MKKFLKLLDPYERPAFFDSEAAVRHIDEEQQRAREQFPLMVAQSNLHYWRPGDPNSTQGIRFLLALGAGFSLKDLRFADVFNEALSKSHPKPIRVDVFDVDDVSSWEQLCDYFPGKTRHYIIPIIGVWEEGMHQTTLYGLTGMDRVLRELQVPILASDIVANIHPPDPKLMED